MIGFICSERNDDMTVLRISFIVITSSLSKNETINKGK